MPLLPMHTVSCLQFRFAADRVKQSSPPPAPQAQPPPQALVEEVNTPSDITAPSPSTSETSTVFTDVDGEEDQQAGQPETIQGSTAAQSNHNILKSPATSLKVFPVHIEQYA